MARSTFVDAIQPPSSKHAFVRCLAVALISISMFSGCKVRLRKPAGNPTANEIHLKADSSTEGATFKPVTTSSFQIGSTSVGTPYLRTHSTSAHFKLQGGLNVVH